MRVVFDNIIFFLQRSGGGTIYWLELIKRATTDKSIQEYFSEPKLAINNKFRSELPIKVTFFERAPLLWLRISNFSKPLQDKFIFHSSYYRISKSKQAINVVTVHDFTSEYYLKGIRRLIHKMRKRNAISNAQGIICISHNTKIDLLKMYRNIDEKLIRVIYNGVSDDYFTISKTNDFTNFEYPNILKAKYILYVGHRTNYKNFFIAVETVARLDSSYKLLIIGESLSKSEVKIVDKILKNRYICLSGIDNKTLNIFYNFAYCLIYPSSYEGFGIPLLEAMRASCPVVTTNKSSIPEVVGDSAVMVSDISSTTFVDAILMLSDEKFRSELILRGLVQSSKFSWDKSYEEVKKYYVELFNCAE